MTGSDLLGGETTEFCAAARKQVAEVFPEYLGPRLRSLSVFGSVATGGPLWAGSDLDLVVIVDRAAGGTAQLCRQVALASNEATALTGLPVSATVGTWQDVSMLWSATVRRALADNAVTLTGEPLAELLTPQGHAWDWTEVLRGAARLLCFTRRHIIDRYTTMIQVQGGPDGRADVPAADGMGILKHGLNAARFALWSVTPEGRPLLSRPDQVQAAFCAAFSGMSAKDVPWLGLDHLLHSTSPPPALLAACVDLADGLLQACRRHNAALVRQSDIFIDPL
jgi:hypothetical protein